MLEVVWRWKTSGWKTFSFRKEIKFFALRRRCSSAFLWYLMVLLDSISTGKLECLKTVQSLRKYPLQMLHRGEWFWIFYDYVKNEVHKLGNIPKVMLWRRRGYKSGERCLIHYNFNWSFIPIWTGWVERNVSCF